MQPTAAALYSQPGRSLGSLRTNRQASAKLVKYPVGHRLLGAIERSRRLLVQHALAWRVVAQPVLRIEAIFYLPQKRQARLDGTVLFGGRAAHLDSIQTCAGTPIAFRKAAIRYRVEHTLDFAQLGIRIQMGRNAQPKLVGIRERLLEEPRPAGKIPHAPHGRKSTCRALGEIGRKLAGTQAGNEVTLLLKARDLPSQCIIQTSKLFIRRSTCDIRHAGSSIALRIELIEHPINFVQGKAQRHKLSNTQQAQQVLGTILSIAV